MIPGKVSGVIVLVLVVAFAIPMIGANQNWIIDGDSIYVDDANVFINVSPHTIPDDGEVTIELLSKVYTGDIDVLFGFDTDEMIPEYAQLLVGEEWIDVGGQFNYINYDFQGFDRWYYATDIPIVQDNLYTFRFGVDVGFNTSGKYWFGVKPSSETLAQVIANGHFYYIDPWWDNTFLNKFNVWFNSTATGTSQNITRHLMFDTQSIIDDGFMNVSCKDIRVVNTWENDTLDWQFEDPDNDTWGCNAINTTLWVRLPLFNTSNYSAWVYYNKFTEGQRGIASGDVGVWDDGVKLAVHITNNTANDRSSNNNHGTVFGSSGSTNGTFTNSLIFDGSSDRVDFSDSADFTNEIFAVSVWANVNSFNTVAPWMIGAGNEGSNSWSMRISQNTGFQPMFAGGDCLHTIPVTLTDTWFNIVSVYDGTDSDQKIWTYINGEFNLSATCSFTYTEDVGAIRMGEGLSGFNRWYDGQLDEVVYIAKNLSAQDVKRMYEQQLISFGAQETFAGAPPTVNITFPLNQTTREIDFDYNATTTGNVDAVIMNAGGANLTASNNTEGDYFNLSGTHPSLVEGIHNLTVWANNSAGITSDIVFFRIDRTAPVVSLPVFTNATTVGTSSSFGVNIFVTDDQAVGDTCLVSVQGQTSNTTIALSGGWCNGSVSTAGASGSDNISVFTWANDSANNWGLNDSYVISLFGALNVSIIDEITNQPYNMSIPNETVLSIFCSDQTNRTIISDNILIGLPTNCTIEQISVQMDFGADIGTIIRALIPNSTEGNITFYMPNPINHTIAIVNIKVIDLTNRFPDGLLRLKKIIGSQTVDILEQEFGTGGNVNVYVIANERYKVEVENKDGTALRKLDELTVVASGSLDLTIAVINFRLNESFYNENLFRQVELDQVANTITFSYQDLLEDTINITFEVFNASNTSQLLFSDNAVGVNSWTTTYSGVTPNQSYIYRITIWHNDFTNNPFIETFTIGYAQRLVGDDVSVGTDALALIGLFVITTVGFIFNRRYAAVGAITVATLIALFTFVFGIFDSSILTWGTMVLLFLIAFFTKLTSGGTKV